MSEHTDTLDDQFSEFQNDIGLLIANLSKRLNADSSELRKRIPDKSAKAA